MTKPKKQPSKVRKAKREIVFRRQLMHNAAAQIARKLVQSKAANDGRIPYGYAAELLKAGQECFPKLARSTINNHISRIEKGLIADENSLMEFNLSSITTANGTDTSDVSPLTISPTIVNPTSDSDQPPEEDEEDLDTIQSTSRNSMFRTRRS